MKKASIMLLLMMTGISVFADTVIVREPGIVEGLVTGTGGIVTGLLGFTKDLLVGRTVTYSTPAGMPAVPSCAVVTAYPQPVVIPSAQPVIVTPAVQPAVVVPQPVAVVPYHSTVVYTPYRGWGPPPLRPRHYYHPCPPPYPGPYPRPALR